MTYRNAILLALVCLFNLLIITSCTPAYIPNTINTPLLTRKGEVQAAIHSGISGFDPQLAYALTDDIGLMLNGSFLLRNKLDSMQNNYHKHSFVEAGAGYYKAIGGAGRVEVFGGLGFGNVDAHFYNNAFSSYTNANYHRFFLQPSVGATSNIFDGSFTPRLAMVYMNLDEHSFQGLYDRGYIVYLEPVLTGRVGYKYVKLSGQMGFSWPLNRIDRLYYQYQPFIFAIGLHFTIGKEEKASSPYHNLP